MFAKQPKEYLPSRPLRPGELFDVCTGRFISSLGQSTGCVRKLAITATQCWICDRPIKIGEEYEEDLARACTNCAERGRRRIARRWRAVVRSVRNLFRRA